MKNARKILGAHLLLVNLPRRALSFARLGPRIRSLMERRRFPPPWCVEDKDNGDKNWHAHPSHQEDRHGQSASLQ
jgi:hypothetical protein